MKLISSDGHLPSKQLVDHSSLDDKGIPIVCCWPSTKTGLWLPRAGIPQNLVDGKC